MIFFTVYCPTCRRSVNLPSHSVALREEPASPSGWVYVFDHCDMEWERVADQWMWRVLLNAGARLESTAVADLISEFTP